MAGFNKQSRHRYLARAGVPVDCLRIHLVSPEIQNHACPSARDPSENPTAKVFPAIVRRSCLTISESLRRKNRPATNGDVKRNASVYAACENVTSVQASSSRSRRSRHSQGRSMPSTSRFRRETPRPARPPSGTRSLRGGLTEPSSGSNENRSRRQAQSRKRGRLVAAPLKNQCQVTLTSTDLFSSAIAPALPWVTIRRRRQSDRSQVPALLRSRTWIPRNH
jgi:hypothetical protein